MASSEEPNPINPAHGIDVQELYDCQTRIALYLKDACKCFSDFQDLSREVRLTANEARAVQSETCSMMTRSGVTLNHITETMIPLVYTGIELEDLTLLGKAFDQVIEHAESMKNKPKAVAERYLQLQKNIAHQLKAAETKYEAEMREFENIKKQLPTKELLIEEAKIEQIKLITRKLDLEETMKCLKNQLQRANAGTDNCEEAHPTSSSNTEQTWGQSVMDLTSWLCKSVKEKTTGWSTENIDRNKRITEIDNTTLLVHQESHQVSESLHKINNKVIEQTAALDELKAWKVRHADTESLIKVLDLLERIQQHFGRLVLFWESMKKEVFNLKTIIDFGQKIQVQQARDRFKGYDTDCQDLTSKFQQYVRDCEMGIGNLFRFVYMPDDKEDTSEFDMANRNRALPLM